MRVSERGSELRLGMVSWGNAVTAFLPPTPYRMMNWRLIRMPINVRFKMNIAWYIEGQTIECERDAKTEELINLGVIEEVTEKSDLRVSES